MYWYCFKVIADVEYSIPIRSDTVVDVDQLSDLVTNRLVQFCCCNAKNIVLHYTLIVLFINFGPTLDAKKLLISNVIIMRAVKWF